VNSRFKSASSSLTQRSTHTPGGPSSRQRIPHVRPVENAARMTTAGPRRSAAGYTLQRQGHVLRSWGVVETRLSHHYGRRSHFEQESPGANPGSISRPFGQAYDNPPISLNQTSVSGTRNVTIVALVGTGRLRLGLDVCVPGSKSESTVGSDIFCVFAARCFKTFILDPASQPKKRIDGARGFLCFCSMFQEFASPYMLRHLEED